MLLVAWCVSTRSLAEGLFAGSVLSKDTASAFVALGAFMLLILVLLRRTRTGSAPPEPRRRPKTLREKREEKERESPKQPLRGEAEKLLVELEEFGREIEGRLETRIRYLSRLLTEADRAIERLNAALEAASQRASGEAAEAPRDSGAGGVRERILSLSTEGRDPEEIAKELGVPKGEVELVLGLAGKAAERPKSG